MSGVDKDGLESISGARGGGKPIKIILVDDHQIVRRALRALLAAEPDMEVIGEADNGRTALRLVRELKPQVVIMDISMPNLNGIEATRQILAESPGIKVIALSMHAEGLFVSNMLKAGAKAYLRKDCALEELIEAIRTVMEKKTYLSPGCSDVVIRDLVSQWTPSSSAFSILSARERETLQLLAEGHSTKQIANSLCVSVKTVEAHRQQIMAKIGIPNIASLTKYAVSQGLTPL
jgi:two-component system response regulator NreC